MKTWYLVLLKPGKGKALKAKEKLESMGDELRFILWLHRKQMRKDRKQHDESDITAFISRLYVFMF
ncbi:hypothetical protein [Salmonella enterica]|uniref:hypothetical protein n=1 Tax=Salmonella enterica TaxID=28901 RepID=UPI001FF4ADBA|nr:hypothetical protein [Salmonella enterica]UOY24680.1 hypothetical protein MNU28_23335 [Salmonella enterica subsp. enterica serovar Infantis]